MNPKKTISVTEARKRIFEIIEDVQKPDTYYTLTENGKPKAVVLSVEEFESLWETIETYEDFPNLAKDIKEAEEEIARGEYVTLEDLLAKEGYVLADKGKAKYEVSRRRTKKNPKNN